MSAPLPYVALTSCSALVTGGLAAYFWPRRDRPGALPLCGLLVAVTVWTGCYGLAITRSDPVAFEAWWRAGFLGNVVTPVAWLAFTLEYAGRDRWVTPRRVGAVALPLAAGGVLVFTNGAHGLMWTDATLATTTPVPRFDADFGVLYWVLGAYAYTVATLGVAVLASLAAQTRELYRDQLGALALAVLAPVVADGLTLSGVRPGGLSLTPYGFAVSGVALWWAVRTHDLVERLPVAPTVAKDAVVEGLHAGIVVLDADRRVVDANPTAARLLADDPTGDAFDDALPAVAPLVDRAASRFVRDGHVVVPSADGGGTTEDRSGVVGATNGGQQGPDEPDEAGVDLSVVDDVHLADGHRERHFRVAVSPLDGEGSPLDGRGPIVGWVVSLHDVTDRILREQRLNVLNRVLRHNVRNQTSVIQAYADGIADLADDEIADHATTIGDAADSLVAWADRAREVDRALGDPTGTADPVDAVACVEAAVDGHRDAQNATVTTDCPERAMVAGPPTLERVVDELVGNAIAHDDGDTTVAVDVTRRPDSVEVTVTDDGPGVPDEEVAALQQGTETALQHGSGLGLWLVVWTVRAAGGEVTFADREAGGTRVTLSLPPGA